MCPTFLKQYRELYKFRNILKRFIRLELTIRYRKSVLGYLWTLINPLAMMSITAVVFATLFKQDLKTFSIFLFSGMVPWNLFSQTISTNCNSLLGKENLIKKVYLPKLLFPLSISISQLIDNISSFFILIGIMIFLGLEPKLNLIYIIIPYVILFFFTLGISLIFSILTVYLRDLQHLIQIFLQALFFLTPIMYKPDLLRGRLDWLIYINPLAKMISLFRTIIIEARLPELSLLSECAFYAILSFSIGNLVFFYYQKKVIYRF